MEKISHQVRRATERREGKMPAGTVVRKSTRHIGRTKGMPYSRMTLHEIVPSSSGVPAKFIVSSPTRKGTKQTITAKVNNLDWFVRGLTPQMKMSLLGAY